MAEIQAMGRKAAVFKADFDDVNEVLQLAERRSASWAGSIAW